MKKQLSLLVLLITFFFAAQAQEGDIKIGVGADVGLPIGNWSNGYGVGIGVTGKGYYGLKDVSDITFTTGFIRFGGKDSNDFSTTLIPFLAGYRHKFDNLYVEPQLGLTTVSTKVNLGTFGSVSGSSTNLGYGVGGGYMMDNWDFGVRFQGVSSGGSISFLAFRVGYNFSL